MRNAFLILVALFIWSGSISIYFRPQPILPSPSSQSSCSNPSSYGEALMETLRRGNLIAIRDDGHVLTVGLSANWAALSTEEQQTTVYRVRCYAQSQNRQLHYYIPSDSEFLSDP